MHSSPSWSPLIADLCARRRTRSAMLLRDGACWTSAASPCFVLRSRRRDLRLLLSADCHRATSNRRRLQCVPFALLLVLCSLQPARAASELKDIAKLAELALRRYEPSFKLTGNVSETLVSLLSSLRSSRLSHRLEAVNCSPPFNGSALCKEGAECLSVGDLLQLFPEAAESSVGEALVRLCPVLIFQMQHRSCDFTPSVASRGKTRPTPAQVWGFGMLAVFVISCCSLAGLVIVPFLSHVLYHRLLMVFEGLAVGSLLGSAVFHLIPQAFNLLGQDQEHDYLWKSLIVFLGVYLFYLSDKVMRFIADYRQAHNHEHRIKAGDGIAAVAWMIIFGDGMHNFIDGLSIGAAFSESLLAGASISVAVVCEEFPHELDGPQRQLVKRHRDDSAAGHPRFEVSPRGPSTHQGRRQASPRTPAGPAHRGRRHRFLRGPSPRRLTSPSKAQSGPPREPDATNPRQPSRGTRDVATWTSQDGVDPPAAYVSDRPWRWQERARIGTPPKRLFRLFQGRTLRDADRRAKGTCLPLPAGTRLCGCGMVRLHKSHDRGALHRLRTRATNTPPPQPRPPNGVVQAMLARAARKNEFAEWLLHVATGHPGTSAGTANQPAAESPTAEQPAAKTTACTASEDAAAVADSNNKEAAEELQEMETGFWAILDQ
ncbi:uncharacterized protein [Dermacentor albipictus]|uniref:uncharacterized protein isoform X3 n=1 Tax=Dermacentor albipictus TaxID=60249 RepID=UPI0038FCC672